MSALSFVYASEILVDAKYTIKCGTGTLCDAYFLNVGTFPEGGVNIHFLRCREPDLAFIVKVTSEMIVGARRLSARGVK
jgi:hypothetical protein